MSTSKLDRSGVFEPVTVHGQTTKLALSASQVVVRKNGIEFISPTAISAWTELTVDLRPPGSQKAVRGNGVVVDCVGNRHSGYVVSLVFMDLTPHSQQQLIRFAQPRAR